MDLEGIAASATGSKLSTSEADSDMVDLAYPLTYSTIIPDPGLETLSRFICIMSIQPESDLNGEYGYFRKDHRERRQLYPVGQS
jgi:hypothetical protein